MRNVIFSYEELTTPIFTLNGCIRRMSKEGKDTTFENKQLVLCKRRINWLLETLSKNYCIYLFSKETVDDMKHTLIKQEIFSDCLYYQVPKKVYKLYSPNLDYQNSILISGNQFYLYLAGRGIPSLATCMVRDMCRLDFLDVSFDYEISSIEEIPHFLSSISIFEDKKNASL